jgi:hypothetical protein
LGTWGRAREGVSFHGDGGVEKNADRRGWGDGYLKEGRE